MEFAFEFRRVFVCLRLPMMLISQRGGSSLNNLNTNSENLARGALLCCSNTEATLFFRCLFRLCVDTKQQNTHNCRFLPV